MNWLKYKKGEVEAGGLSKHIVEALGSDLNGFSWKRKKWKKKTKQVMKALSRLGDNKHFKVLSNKIPNSLRPRKGKFLKKEWLYDLHWFTDPGGYKLKRLPLVVECEWHWTRGKNDKQRPKDRYGEVKWDFQKLLVTNAELRLMIFRKRPDKTKADKQTNKRLGEYFEKRIEGYEHLAGGAKFLFVAFDFDKEEFCYAERRK